MFSRYMKSLRLLFLGCIALASCTTADLSKEDGPAAPDPVKPGETEYSVRISIPCEQILTEYGYDTKALESAYPPEDFGAEYGPGASFLYFRLEGDEDRTRSINSIKLTLNSENPETSPFGTVEITVKRDDGGSSSDYAFVSGKRYSSGTLSGRFKNGTYAFIAFPFDYLGISYEVWFSDGTSKTFDHSDCSFSCVPGGSADLPVITIDPAPKAVTGWFELPYCKDDNLDGIDDWTPDFHYSFTRRADEETVRNFSCCYSKEGIHPVWVAAPMHECYTGSSGRNDSYQPDPQISCTQAGRWEGYTRGHLLASSERTVSRPTNRQVFYYSNIGAQMQTGFNTGNGAWNNLENYVTEQWCSDTLYQVVGCIFESWTDRYGVTVDPVTQDGSRIPTAYYKALLRTKDGDSGKSVDECTESELKCCAFIIAHRSNAGHKPSENDLYSVEELEMFTGIKYFVNVPNAPKQVVKASDWGL